jgi:hypothetical protein
MTQLGLLGFPEFPDISKQLDTIRRNHPYFLRDLLGLDTSDTFFNSAAIIGDF